MQTTSDDELAEFRADHLWIEQHRTPLLSQYPDRWIAVRNRQVVAHDSDLDGLLAQLPDPAHTCVEFLAQEPIEMIL